MNKVTVNEKYTFELESNHQNDWDLLQLGKGKFHILKDHQSYEAEIVEADLKSKTLHVLINGRSYHVAVKDKMDLLLEKMGMSAEQSNQVKEIKAPMPGLVLEIKVAEGDTIEQGDGVLVLEAMKMENLLKSPGAGVVKSIEVQQGDAIEKGQLLIHLE